MRVGQVTGTPVLQFLSNVSSPLFEGEENLPVGIRLIDVHQTVLLLKGHLSPIVVLSVDIFLRQ